MGRFRVLHVARFGGILASVHAEVGCDAERFSIGSVVREDSDAYAGADAHGVSVQFEGIIEKLSQRLAHTHGVVAARGFFKDHRKLIAAGAGNGVGAAHPAQERSPTRFSSSSPT